MEFLLTGGCHGPCPSSSGDVCVSTGTPELLVQSKSLLPGQDHGGYSIPGQLPRVIDACSIPTEVSAAA